MRLDNGQLPTDSQLMSDVIAHSFAAIPGGFGPSGLPLIPREEWADEFNRMHAEEKEWWKGEVIDCLLTVELPFRLMIPNGPLEITYEETVLNATVRSDFVEIYHGPSFLGSHANVAFIGPAASLGELNIASIVPNNMPVYRDMKTTVIFDAKAMKDALLAASSNLEITDRSQMRRLNRSLQYLKSLAFGHIPFLNSLITAYRSVSLDPYAFEVTEWDVPVWYAEDGNHVNRIGLMPYWDCDEPFSLNSADGKSPFFAASLDQVKLQLAASVVPGKIELLDALSLSYRGRYGEAVRASVTAIEVALEAKLKQLMIEKGGSENDVKKQLEETRNSFFQRLAHYERLSLKRIPGPVLSLIPYINGMRLRDELEWVRNLRHKVVHEGIRIDIHSRGSMLRAIETMTWLFQWLNHDDAHGPESNRNYTFFSALRGMRQYPFEYRGEGVVVSPEPVFFGESETRTTDELLEEMYDDAIGVEKRDIDLFVRMSFQRLGLDCEEGPPQGSNAVLQVPRFTAQLDGRQFAVFCIECDGLPEVEAATNVVASAAAFQRQNIDQHVAICIVHHQRHLAASLRERAGAVSATVEQVFCNCGLAVLTAVDLQFLIKGMEKFNWNPSSIRELLLIPGRQGLIPPGSQVIGIVRKLFPRISVMSVEIESGKSVRLGQTIAIRTPTRWHEERVDSLQLDKVAVVEANGPCRVGIGTTICGSGIREGEVIFVREQLSAEAPESCGID